MVSDSEPPKRCTTCGAEAGLEPAHGTPTAMKVFGLIVAGVAVIALGGSILARVAG